MNYKAITLGFMFIPIVSFYRCTTHKIGMDSKKVTACTKETTTTTTKNPLTGKTTTTTTTKITPCGKEDCPAKKHGI